MFLDHLIVPARDMRKSAQVVATLLGVPWAEAGVGPFCPVYLNDGTTLDFDQWDGDGALPVLHYCFRMADAEFDQVLARLVEIGIAYRSSPHGPSDSRVNTQFGGRIVYWSEPDGHVLEALTVSYARASRARQSGGG